jgi:hypothetical protein
VGDFCSAADNGDPTCSISYAHTTPDALVPLGPLVPLSPFPDHVEVLCGRVRRKRHFMKCHGGSDEVLKDDRRGVNGLTGR